MPGLQATDPAALPPVRLRWRPSDAAFEVVDHGDAGEVAVVDSWLTHDGRARRLDLHAARFSRACDHVAGVPADHHSRRFFEAAVAQIPATGAWFPRVELAIDARARLQACLQLWLRPAPPRGETVSVWVATGADRRARPDVKGADLAHLQDLRTEAIGHGADEALILAPDGRIREGATTSVMWWEDDTLCTVPPSPAILASVTRAILLEAAAAAGTPVAFATRTPEELAGREVWTVNALHGIRPIRRWIGREIEAGPAPHAVRWSDELDRMARPAP